LPSELAGFSEVSRDCRGAASLDMLWAPWLGTHFALFTHWDAWGPTPAIQFSALATSVKEWEERAKECQKQMERLLVGTETNFLGGA
jgi:hypothetical protein